MVFVNALLLALVVPIALVGWHWGHRPAWAAVAMAIALVAARTWTHASGPGALGDLSLAVAFATVAVLASALYRSDRPADALGPNHAYDHLLTRREREVLERMADGETNAEIAEHLVIAESTVKSHVKNILRKLSAANRTEAVGLYYGARTDSSVGGS